MNSSFPNRWRTATVIENGSKIYLYLFSSLNCKAKQEAEYAAVIQATILLKAIYTKGQKERLQLID